MNISFSAGADLRRRNNRRPILTSKVDSRTEKVKYLKRPGIQIKRKEINKTFVMILNLKNVGLHNGLYKNITDHILDHGPVSDLFQTRVQSELSGSYRVQ